MAVTAYDRVITKEVLIGDLITEIENSSPTISSTLLSITEISTDNYRFLFDPALSVGEEATLDAVIAAHNPTGGGPGGNPPNGFKVKAGIIPAASFTGNPKTASVTFSKPYLGGSPIQERYVVTFAVRVTNQNTQYIPTVSAFDENGFTVSLGTSSTANLIEVCWQSLLEGEES